MSGERVERRLAAILAADVAGYSRLMGQDEAGTLARLKLHRRELIDAKIAEHKGRLVKTTGDGLLIEFSSVVDAVRCAVEVQEGMAERNAGVPKDQAIRLRIGINLGDVIVEGDDIYGDGVNIAARLEGLAEPGGICISEDAFRQVRGKIAAEFTDIGEQALKNITRPIRTYRVMAAPGAASTRASSGPALPDKPSIAVLPFANMSGDPEQEYFADGMVEEIITALSRIRWLFVIARNSSFTYRGQAVDVKQVGRELGVRYVLEGSVRKGGDRVRITAQLIEAETGTHLWADRFDGSLEKVFDLQDQVAISVAGVIEPTLEAVETRRSGQRPTNDLTAYDLYLRAFEQFHYQPDKDGYLRALELLDHSIQRDHGYGPALALAAFCHHALHVTGWADDPDATHHNGIEFARRALRSGGDDPGVLANVAYVFGYFGEDITAAVALADRALELNPSSARGWSHGGWLRLWSGQPDLAIDHFKSAIRLNPREGGGRAFLGIGAGHFFARRFEEAASNLLRSLQETPSWVPNYRFLAACYAQMGRSDEARAIITRLRELTADVVPNAEHWRNPEHRDLYLSGLRLAAGEET